MSNRWWIPFSGMEEMAFKRMPGGYLYRAPNPWLVGSGRYYLLNEQQKSEIAVRVQRMWRYFAAAIAIVVAVAVPLSMRWVDQHPFVFLGATALVGLVMGLCLNVYLANAVQPLVAGLTPTDQRISQREGFITSVTVFPKGTIIFYGLLSLVLFALNATRPIMGWSEWAPISVFGAILFGACTLYWIVLFVAKHRQSAA
jgi:hypothetical protein